MSGHTHGGSECSHGRGGFGRRTFHGKFGPHAHSDFAGWGGPGRARRGDVRVAVLRLLGETPMHGYQIIQELSQRSGGAWRPSAGSVYPTLQLLEDEGLVASEESSGKRTYRLTDTGRTEAAATADEPAPWDEAAQAQSGNELREAGGRLIAAVRQVAHTANEDQRARAVEVLTDARKKLYAILAED
jgi:DNA-binding PadR family transcriptional regulator